MQGGLRPPPALSVSQWAEANRHLSSEASAKRGNWRSWPFQREPLDCASPSHPCETLVLMCAAQMLKTELGLNLTGCVVATDPGPILFVEPREADAETLSKDRLAPMIRDCPSLKARFVESKSRDSGNTVLHKRFVGGHITIVGAQTPSGLAMRPIRYLILDEVDRYPLSAGSEGDPISLAKKRTTNFWNRKIVLCSTPVLALTSRILPAYEGSDQRGYFVPCPECGHEQVLAWGQVKWGDGIAPENAHYECESCRAKIPHHKKPGMLEAGRWIARNPEGRYPGFHLSQLYSPIRTWGEIAIEFIEAKEDRGRLQVFVNTVLAEPWSESGDSPDWQILAGRAESYKRGTAPRGVAFLTAGVDVQKDRLEIGVWGWGRGKQRWLIDYDVILGDPSRPEVWAQLDEWLTHTYRHDSGLDMQIEKIAIDSGYSATDVYTWARRQSSSRVMVVKGYDSGVALLGLPQAADTTGKGKRSKFGARVWPVNVSMAKAELYGYLRSEKPADGQFPPGYVHFYAMPDSWYKGLVAEQWVTRVVKGFRKGEWQKIYERNEPLDTANYARAAATAVGIDRFTERNWRAFEEQLGTSAPPPAPAPSAAAVPVPAPNEPPHPKQQTASGGWLSGSRGGGKGWFSR